MVLGTTHRSFDSFATLKSAMVASEVDKGIFDLHQVRLMVRCMNGEGSDGETGVATPPDQSLRNQALTNRSGRHRT